MDISCIKCFVEEVWKSNFQNSQPTHFLRLFKYLLSTELMTKYCIWVFCIQFSVAVETVNPKFWCPSRFQKLISNWHALFSNRKFFNYLRTIYKRFQEKNFISFREIVRERFSTFRFRQHFKRLKFDYSYSETVSNQKIKIKNYLLDDCVFLEIRLTHGNQLLGETGAISASGIFGM